MLDEDFTLAKLAKLERASALFFQLAREVEFVIFGDSEVSNCMTIYLQSALPLPHKLPFHRQQKKKKKKKLNKGPVPYEDKKKWGKYRVYI